MTTMMDSVPHILGIDKVNMDGKLMFIEEQHYSNADFLLSSIICNALKRDYNICFVLLHNTFNHYQNICMKFGYNLTLLREKGKIVIVEPMKIVAWSINSMHKEATDNLLHDIFLAIKDGYYKMMENNDLVFTIIDDISHLYDFGSNLGELSYYIRYLRSLMVCNAKSQLCIVAHRYKNKIQSCTLNMFMYHLKHMAQLHVIVEPFRTGYSSDRSGKIAVNWKIDAVRAKYNWPEIARYIYKLSDHHIQIHTPGTSSLFV